MKSRNLLILALLAMNVVLFSCSKENESFVPNKNPVEIDTETKTAIEQFINQVNGITTRWDPKDPTKYYKLRSYVIGDDNCRNGDGSCTPNILIRPDAQKPWIDTPEGLALQNMVNKKQIIMSKEFSPTSNTEFYIYKDVKDKNREIVVPVVYQ